MSPVKLNSKYLTNIPQKTLFEYADELSVRVPTSCKRNGECHECIVEVSKGNEKGRARGTYRPTSPSRVPCQVVSALVRRDVFRQSAAGKWA